MRIRAAASNGTNHCVVPCACLACAVAVMIGNGGLVVTSPEARAPRIRSCKKTRGAPSLDLASVLRL